MKTNCTSENNIRSSIAAYLRNRSGISLIEMCRDVDGFAGDKTWAIVDANLVVWPGMSVEAVEAMMAMILAEEIIPTVTTPFVYLYDGGMLDMPVAKRLKYYKTKRWIPLVFAGGAA